MQLVIDHDGRSSTRSRTLKTLG